MIKFNITNTTKFIILLLTFIVNSHNVATASSKIEANIERVIIDRIARTKTPEGKLKMYKELAAELQNFGYDDRAIEANKKIIKSRVATTEDNLNSHLAIISLLRDQSRNSEKNKWLKKLKKYISKNKIKLSNFHEIRKFYNFYILEESEQPSISILSKKEIKFIMNTDLAYLVADHDFNFYMSKNDFIKANKAMSGDYTNSPLHLTIYKDLLNIITAKNKKLLCIKSKIKKNDLPQSSYDIICTKLAKYNSKKISFGQKVLEYANQDDKILYKLLMKLESK